MSLSSTRRIKVFKAISITLGLALSLLFAEIVYRIYCFYVQRDFNDMVQVNRPPVINPHEDLKLGQIIQLSTYPKVVYELIPNSSYHFMNVPVKTNSKGFRSDELSANKTAQSRRIIGLGDSVMFGWGVNQDESYLSLLEAKMDSLGTYDFEVVNTGVPGYNTTMEVETLERKFDISEVDYVIINFVGNDLDMPNFIQKKQNYWTIEKSFILMRFESKDDWERKDNRLRDAPFDNKTHAFEQDLEDIPEEYHSMVGLNAFQHAMQRLHSLAEIHNFKVLVLSTDPDAPAPDFVKNACLENDFKLLEINSFWAKYKKESPTAKWKLGENDGHPNAVGHQFIADALADFFKSNPVHD